HFTTKPLRIRVLQVSVFIPKPGDVFLWYAEDLTGLFFFRAPDPGQALAGHLQIERALIVVCKDDYLDVVPIVHEDLDDAAARKRFIVGMRCKKQHRPPGPRLDG